MPSKNKGSDSENESTTKKQKTDLESELAASRLSCGDSVLEFREGKLGEGYKSRVRTLAGDAGVLLRECRGVLYWAHRDKRVQVSCHWPRPGHVTTAATSDWCRTTGRCSTASSARCS